ncbi:MAG: BrnT family toxin [Desulfobacterales bacterium]
MRGQPTKFENRYYALGRIDMDRLLFAVFTFRNGKIRIISARDMTVPAMAKYQK